MTRAIENRQRIIEATAPLFNRKGYAGTSMADVLESTGLHKGSVYLCFPSKDDLALAVFEYSAGTMMANFEKVFEQAGEQAVDQLLAFIDVYANIKEQGPLVGGCPILNTAIESDDAYPFLREKVATALRHWQDQLGNVVQRGIARGEFKPDTDPVEVSNMLIAGIEGALMMMRLLQDPLPMRHMVENLRRHVLDLCVKQLN